MEELSMDARLLGTLWTLNNAVAKKVDNKLGLHGINFTEFQVLNYLRKQKERQARRADLAQNVGLTASGITRMLAPMEKIGLVQKEQNSRDARVSLVKLTQAGDRILTEATTSINEVSSQIFESLQLEEKENLLGQLGMLSRLRF